jgi:phthalate 4,5-cis-dihydrodiol dehydrogenase
MPESEGRILRLGFIGVGQAVNRMFQQYDDLAKLPYRVVAAADPREHALREFGAQFGAATYTRAEDLCRDPNVDVVYVATPPELHREHVELAASHGKHVVVEKPMALTIADCDAMVAAAERAGVQLLAGHTHSFDAPIRKMREIITGGTLGNVLMINTWNFNDFNVRPWTTKELRGTFGPILNQAPHQVDIVRQLAGGMVKSVRAETIPDGLRGCEAGWTCFLEFTGGVSATLVYDARGFFDTAELSWWVGEGGLPREPDTNARMRQYYRKLDAQGPDERERLLEVYKEQGRYGAGEMDPELRKLRGYHGSGEATQQPFFGLTVVSCERGAIRQSANGLLVYDDEGVHELPIQREMRGRAAELMDLYGAVVNGAPIFHDGRWGRATLEVCVAILESARTHRTCEMSNQVAMPS